MTSLLPDESYCTSELGRLLFQPKSEWSGHCYVADAKETSQIGVKFVEYTCVIVMTPRQVLQLDARTFVLPTRYKLLNKLHGALRKLHSQLYLKTVFPAFPEARWIGGNDAATIAERKAATETFLTFLLCQDVLRKSRVFHQFIEMAEEKVPEAIIIDVHSTLAGGHTLLDSHNVISSEVAPVMQPDNDNPTSSRLSSPFEFDDVSIEESSTMSGQGRAGFLREYLSRFTKRNETEEYLVIAGRFVSTAQLAETEGAYEVAFYSYKDAANVLIKGMESERSLSNRNAVRLKSAKYIEKAEQIYRNHLRYDNGPLFDMRNIHRDNRDDLAFRSSNSALKSFRFVGVLPSVESEKRVFLVRETESDRQFVMKLVERRADACSDGIFLPTNVPHMVPLVKFFTTTNYVILLLPYVKTGRLWSFLSGYFADSVRKHELREKKEANEDFVENEVRNKENPYRGRHTRFSVSADCERLAVLENEALEEAVGSAVICSVGEDAAGMDDEQEEGHQRYLLLPSDTVSANSMVVEEESPAAVTISMRRDVDGKDDEVLERTHAEEEEEEEESGCRRTGLAQALHECRGYLKHDKRQWQGAIAESLIVHWSAQCISMIYVLHSHGVFIGDLHPDNLLIDEGGNLQFTYQARWASEWKERQPTPGYAAPETFYLPLRVSAACDVWSVGAFLYELLVGRPLASAAPHGMEQLSELAFIPDAAQISFSARDLLERILQFDPEERVTIDQIRAHPFYSSIDWLLYDNPHGPAGTAKREKEKKEIKAEADSPGGGALEREDSELSAIEKKSEEGMQSMRIGENEDGLKQEERGEQEGMGEEQGRQEEEKKESTESYEVDAEEGIGEEQRREEEAKKESTATDEVDEKVENTVPQDEKLSNQ